MFSVVVLPNPEELTADEDVLRPLLVGGTLVHLAVLAAHSLGAAQHIPCRVQVGLPHLVELDEHRQVARVDDRLAEQLVEDAACNLAVEQAIVLLTEALEDGCGDEEGRLAAHSELVHEVTDETPHDAVVDCPVAVVAAHAVMTHQVVPTDTKALDVLRVLDEGVPELLTVVTIHHALILQDRHHGEVTAVVDDLVGELGEALDAGLGDNEASDSLDTRHFQQGVQHIRVSGPDVGGNLRLRTDPG